MPEVRVGEYKGRPLLHFERAKVKGKVQPLFMDKDYIDGAQRNKERQSKTLHRPDSMDYTDETKKYLRRKKMELRLLQKTKIVVETGTGKDKKKKKNQNINKIIKEVKQS